MCAYDDKRDGKKIIFFKTYIKVSLKSVIQKR